MWICICIKKWYINKMISYKQQNKRDVQRAWWTWKSWFYWIYCLFSLIPQHVVCYYTSPKYMLIVLLYWLLYQNALSFVPKQLFLYSFIASSKHDLLKKFILFFFLLNIGNRKQNHLGIIQTNTSSKNNYKVLSYLEAYKVSH